MSAPPRKDRSFSLPVNMFLFFSWQQPLSAILTTTTAGQSRSLSLKTPKPPLPVSSFPLDVKRLDAPVSAVDPGELAQSSVPRASFQFLRLVFPLPLVVPFPKTLLRALSVYNFRASNPPALRGIFLPSYDRKSLPFVLEFPPFSAFFASPLLYFAPPGSTLSDLVNSTPPLRGVIELPSGQAYHLPFPFLSPPPSSSVSHAVPIFESFTAWRNDSQRASPPRSK